MAQHVLSVESPDTLNKCSYNYCNKEFFKDKHHPSQKFCSTRCGRLEKRRQSGKWVFTGETCTCSICSNIFIKDRHNKEYCCRAHLKIAIQRRHEKKPDRIKYLIKYHQEVGKFRKNPHSQYKKNECESCGFKAVHSCQLDVDHIDGNHDNNHLSNLKTLCANCHRLKTQLHSDWDKRLKQKN